MHTPSKIARHTSGEDYRAQNRALVKDTIDPAVAEALNPDTPPQRVCELVTKLLGYGTIAYLSLSEVRALMDALDDARRQIEIEAALAVELGLKDPEDPDDDDDGGGSPGLFHGRQTRGMER